MSADTGAWRTDSGPSGDEDVVRYDRASLGNIERLDSGALRIPATPTRAGVFEYTRADGSVRREYCPPEEAFAEDSLRTLRAAALTIRHPREPVTTRNHARLSCGHVTDEVRRDGDGPHVYTEVVVTRQDAVDKVLNEELVELSCGYRCRIDHQSGTTPDGEPYDVIQRRRRYNHLALLGDGEARGGRAMRLRLDSQDNAVLDDDSLDQPPGGRRTDRKEKTMDEVELTIDGITIKVPKAAAAAFEAKQAEKANALSQAQTRNDELQGRVDSLTEDKEKLQGKLDAAEDPARLDSLMQKRVALVTSASKVLGDEVKLDGMSDKEVRLAVCKQAYPDRDFAERSDGYIEGVYETAIESAPAKGKGTQQRQDAGDGKGRRNPGIQLIHRVQRDDSKDGAQSRLDKANTELGQRWQKPIGGAVSASK